MLNGDFTFGGAGQPLYDPLTTRQNADGTWTRDPFPTRVIPQNRFDPVASKVLSYNPWRPPNMAGSFSSTGPISNFTYNPPSRTFYEDFSGRVDHQFNSRTSRSTAATPTITKRPAAADEHARSPLSTRPTAISRPFTGRTSPLGATKLVRTDRRSMTVRVSFYSATQRHVRPHLQPKTGPRPWAFRTIAPLLMPAFSASGLATRHSTRTAPGYAQLYGLTAGRRQPEDPPDHFAARRFQQDRHGTHAFKMGYEILSFQANYLQLGQPSGVFQFDNMTGRAAADGTPSRTPATLFAACGTRVGAAGQLLPRYTTTWLPRDAFTASTFRTTGSFREA